MVFAQGDEETVVSAVDLDPQLGSGASQTDLAELVAAGATTLTVGARPAFVHAAPDSAGGLLLSIASMDSAFCVKSGEMGSRGGGAGTDLYDCVWSIDVHHLTGASALADAPRATLEGRLRIGAPCGSHPTWSGDGDVQLGATQPGSQTPSQKFMISPVWK